MGQVFDMGRNLNLLHGGEAEVIPIPNSNTGTVPATWLEDPVLRNRFTDYNGDPLPNNMVTLTPSDSAEVKSLKAANRIYEARIAELEAEAKKKDALIENLSEAIEITSEMARAAIERFEARAGYLLALLEEHRKVLEMTKSFWPGRETVDIGRCQSCGGITTSGSIVYCPLCIMAMTQVVLGLPVEEGSFD